MSEARPLGSPTSSWSRPLASRILWYLPLGRDAFQKPESQVTMPFFHEPIPKESQKHQLSLAS